MSASQGVPTDPDGLIEAALASFDRAVMEARLHDDKIGDYLAATAAGIRAHVAIRDDFKRIIDEFAASRAAAQPPITAEDIQRLNKAAASNAAGELIRATDRLLARRQRHLFVLVLVVALVGAIGAGIAMSWWFQPPTTLCTDQNGGRFCGVWVIPERGH